MRMCLVGGIILLLVIIIVPVVITYVWPFKFRATIDESSTRSNYCKQSKVIPSNNGWRVDGNVMDYRMVEWVERKARRKRLSTFPRDMEITHERPKNEN